jgi:hypothetical protein
MSVLSRPQGVPERVWSLVGGLSALGGQSDRDSLDRLLNPGFMKDGLAIRTKPELAGDALGAASSLGFISAGRTDATLGQKVDARTSADFADIVHDHLLSLDATQTDRVLLEAYAWLAAESDRQGDLAWIYEWSRDEFADGANRGLVGEDEDGKPMNSTKAVAWRRWMAFLGLGVAMPIANMPDFPSPASRIAREIERASLERGQDVAADAFLSLIAQRMPYLDGGALYRQACDRIGHQPRPRRLSPLLSAALRDLHDESAIRLIPRGDASNAVRLSDDPAHPIQTFTLVQIGAGTGASA